MNSTQLQERYGQNYQSFFNRYDLIVSVPVLGRHPGTGLFQSKHSYILSEKYPLRNYIGITRSSIDSLQVPSIFFHGSNGEMIQESIAKYYPISPSLLSNIWLRGEVWFLSEYSSLDVPSMVSVIVLSSMLLNEKISPEEISFLSINNPKYQDILSRIVEQDHEFLEQYGFFDKRRNHSGFIGACILKSDSHVFWKTETEFLSIGPGCQFEDMNHSSFLLNPHLFSRPFFQSDSLFLYQKQMEERQKNLHLPQETVSFPDAIESIGNSYLLEMYDRLQESYYHDDNEALFRIFRLFGKFKHGVFADALDREIDVERVSQFMKTRVSKDISLCAVQMWTKIQVFSDRGFDISDKMVEALSLEFWHSFTLEYSSHHDGYEHDGVRIEQWHSRGIESSFRSNKELITLKDRKKVITPVIDVRYNDNYQDGIFVDAVSQKIFVKGIPTTSQSIKSQSTTIDLFRRFLRSETGEANSWELPISSYSRNRSEMSSKIIGPLERLMQDQFGVSVRISMRNEEKGFVVTFDHECPVPIYFLEKRNKS